jgi:hypothetical protein
MWDFPALQAERARFTDCKEATLYIDDWDDMGYIKETDKGFP